MTTRGTGGTAALMEGAKGRTVIPAGRARLRPVRAAMDVAPPDGRSTEYVANAFRAGSGGGAENERASKGRARANQADNADRSG